MDCCVLSECVLLKSGEVSKESLSSPELDCRMDCCFEDEQGYECPSRSSSPLSHSRLGLFTHTHAQMQTQNSLDCCYCSLNDFIKLGFKTPADCQK